MGQLPGLPVIRTAELRDLPAAVGLLRDFHTASDMPFEFSAAWAAGLFSAHCSDPDKVAIVLDDGGAVGVLLGAAGYSPLGPFRIAQELAWWVNPSNRGASAPMLDAYETWAKERGCAFAGVASLAKFPAAAALYARRGYSQAETHFLKAL